MFLIHLTFALMYWGTFMRQRWGTMLALVVVHTTLLVAVWCVRNFEWKD